MMALRRGSLAWLWPLALIGAITLPMGCGESRTPEQVEAAKYPPARKLTPEEEAKARELAGPVTGPPAR